MSPFLPRRLDRGSGLLLLALFAGQPMYGYQVSQALRRQNGQIRHRQEPAASLARACQRCGEGQLYPALHRLERRGLLVGEWCLTADGRRRRVYMLTDDGRQALQPRIVFRQEYAMLLGVGLLLAGGALLLLYAVLGFLASLFLLAPGLLLLLAGAALLGKPPHPPSPRAVCGVTTHLRPPTDEHAERPGDSVSLMHASMKRSE